MATWRDLANDNRLGAKELLMAGRLRSSVSRSYYAAYCAVTNRLVKRVTFGYGNNNPTHNELPDLIMAHLGGISKEKRYRIKKAMVRLQKARTEADYLPTITVEDEDARNAIREMEQIFRLLEVELDNGNNG